MQQSSEKQISRTIPKNYTPFMIYVIDCICCYTLSKCLISIYDDCCYDESTISHTL